MTPLPSMPSIADRVARSSSLFVLLLATSATLTACAAETDEAPPADIVPPPVDSPPEEKKPDDPPPPDEGVAVAHDRELRGAWISTVFNGTWPSKTGLSEADAKAELVAIFDALAAAKMNAVFLQVRPESDALYASKIEPWSRWLTGTQGQDPGWDPLAFAIEKGHERGLEIHAWMNPYRGLTSSSTVAASSHITKMLPDRALGYGTQVWMDPGAPDVRAHILDVVRDILQRYDVDGIHFDDYFYPYPVQGETFEDGPTYALYTNGGGTLGKDDWRRFNVDTLVREVGELVTKERPDVRFGISPFGIYRPGTPAGITGLDAYAVLYCDPVRWMKEKWVDYVAPQLYWPTTRTAQAFGKLVTWWAGLAEGGRSVFIGHDATKVGETDWPLSEYEAQMTLTRAEAGAHGSIFFSAKPLVVDKLALRSTLAEKFWSKPAATPPLASALGATLPLPAIQKTATGIEVTSPNAKLRSIAVYKDGAIERIVPAATKLTLPNGRWEIGTIDRRGVASHARTVELP